ncbi:MAG: hypothetical protein P8X81_03600 [Woeseiaceae bacterium]|jgi:hypothetical protein
MNTEMTNRLDHLLPLKGASHADVVHYGVDIPMRYSECYAKLANGQIVRLRDARQFIGWSGVNGSRKLLFRTAAGRVVVPARMGQHEFIDHDSSPELHKFITRDGGLLFMRSFARDSSQQPGVASAAAI